MAYLITVFGLICFFEGLPYLAFPRQMKRILAQVVQTPGRQLRWFGAALMIIGLVFVYVGRKHGG
jgi:hypothetical protein